MRVISLGEEDALSRDDREAGCRPMEGRPHRQFRNQSLRRFRAYFDGMNLPGN